MTDDPQQRLSALLRLKRYEQPPPAYFDRLLQDIHRRQRAELLHRPLWRIALDRLQALLGEPSVPRWSLAGATAALALGALAIFRVSPPEPVAASALASAPAAPRVGPAPIDLRAAGPSVPVLTLDSDPVLVAAAEIDVPTVDARLLPPAVARETTIVGSPRYIIDPRPASRAATTVSFNF